MEDILAESVNNEMKNVIIGDFNIDLIKSQYSDAMKQKVDFMTKKSDVSETKIDLLFTNEEGVRCVPLPEEQISVHETIAIYVTNKKAKLFSVERIIRSWDDYSKYALMDILQNENWGPWFDGELEDKVMFLNRTLCDAVQNLTQVKCIKGKTSSGSMIGNCVN